jgi:hypothetical protein
MRRLCPFRRSGFRGPADSSTARRLGREAWESQLAPPANPTAHRAPHLAEDRGGGPRSSSSPTTAAA